jgi:predicted MPP superfamily phosphohydrolase
MIIFFGIVLVVYSAVNYYIFRRGMNSLSNDKVTRISYVIIFIILALSYIAGRIFEHYGYIQPAEIFTTIGAFWIAAILYLFLLILLVDFLRALDSIFHFFPEFIKTNRRRTKLYTFYSIAGITCIILLFGYINASNPIVKNIHIKVNKSVEGMKTLRIALVSDIHAGIINGREFVEELTDDLSELRPDIILLPGDIIDESGYVIKEKEILAPFKSLSPKYGIWAVAGNHEYYGGINLSLRLLKQSGIRVLRDKFVKIDNKFYVIGRDDRSGERIGNKKRKKLKSIMEGIDKDLPVILLDHQPIGLEEAWKQNIDLQVSGHTHHGQLFPLNLITNSVYELSWGYMQKDNTHYYVSCGYGTWGPPVRTGNTPEIVVITITFD